MAPTDSPGPDDPAKESTMASGRGLWRAASALCALALGALGCDLIQSAQARRVLAASILATPDYDFTQAVLSLDAGLAVPDGGLPADVGQLEVGGQTVVQAFFGDAPTNSASQSKGILGATVTLEYSGRKLTIPDTGGGTYSLTSLQEKALAFASGADYKLTVASGSESYSATVKAPTSDDSAIEDFHVVAGKPIEIAAGQDLRLTRRATDRVAFTMVMSIDPSGRASKTYTDLPEKAVDLLDLVLNDAKWRQKVITIPGAAAFPAANTYYLVTVTAVDKGSTSSNLFTASTFLAGTPDVGLVKTK
jgi:hypothetical protein